LVADVQLALDMRLSFLKTLALAPLAAFAVTAAACTTGEHAAADAGVAPSTQAAQPPGSPAPPGAPVDPTPIHSAGPPVTGTVAETMGAAGYTYVRLTTPHGDQWAAIPQAQVAVGDTVTIVNALMMDSFQSPTLHRTFDHILFGTLAGAAPQGGPPPSNPHPGMFPGAAASQAVVPGGPVPKATGPDAHTVAEVVTGKDALKDKTVTVRGRVVKVNGGILGKTWLHIQDGSGTGGADGDLLVTTGGAATPAVGDVVTVKGVVHTNRDFGSGYSYAVMIEDAALSK
jgi:hypothetical protein